MIGAPASQAFARLVNASINNLKVYYKKAFLWVGRMGGTAKQISWALKRVGRMSPPEIAHRVVEYLKRAQDRARPRDWTSFGRFAGEVSALPGLSWAEPLETRFVDRLEVEAEAVLSGRFTFLNQSWPACSPTAGEWWKGDIWRLDPVTRRLWPGRELSAFDVDYRTQDQLGDVKFVWELNRLQFLPPLALYAVHASNADAANQVFDILRGWMAANPPGRGVNWSSGIEAASRVVSLLAAVAFVRPKTPEDDAAVRAFLDAHVHWIARYPSRFSSANNHRIAELAALIVAAVCARGLPAARKTLEVSRRRLEREMRLQFHEDGVGAEQSLHYAAYSLEWFTLAAHACDAGNLPVSEGFRMRAGKVVETLSWFLDADGQAPAIGDTDGGRVLALTQGAEPRYIASAGAMTARWLGLQNPMSSSLAPTLRNLFLSETSGGEPLFNAPQPVGVRCFDKGGITVWRQSLAGEALLLAFDHGPLGYLSIAAHGHADALSIWLHLDGEPIFVGPGTYLYHGRGAKRNALRGTAAHNTLSLADQDQSWIIGPFAWRAHARTTLLHQSNDEAIAEHAGYTRRFGLTHRRRIKVEEDAVIVDDYLLGASRKAGAPWSAGFTLAPGIAARLDGPHAELTTPRGRRLSLLSKAQNGGRPGAVAPCWTLIHVPHAPAFGACQPAPRLLLKGIVGSDALVTRTRLSIFKALMI